MGNGSGHNVFNRQLRSSHCQRKIHDSFILRNHAHCGSPEQNPDFARFARKPRDALWSQFITIPVGFALISFIGIIVGSSSAVIYDRPVWNPLDLLSYFLVDPDTGKTATAAARFGVFLISFAFALAQLGTNIAANSVSAGTDMTALLPRYLNIRRGGYICAIVGLTMCPWYASLLLVVCLQDLPSL